MLADIELSPDQRDQVKALIERAKANVNHAQQMAVDASRLLQKTDKNLAELDGTGFFKRTWHACSGKQARVMRATQADLIHMQKIAFGYLAALQEQNLLQAHAIAIIRRNLDEVADTLAETIGNVSLLVDAFERRVGRLEEIVECHEWLLKLPLADYSRMAPASRAIHIVFDYVRAMLVAGITFERIESRGDLAVALKNQKVDAQSTHLLEDLFLEIVSDPTVGARAISAVVASVPGVNGHLVNEYVPSPALQAIYGFERVCPAIEAALETWDKGDSEKAIGNMVRKSVPNADMSYTLGELAVELVAALFFAKEVAATVSASDADASQPSPVSIEVEEGVETFSIDALIGNLIPISRHAYLSTEVDAEDRKRYLESFAVVLSSMRAFTIEQRNYLTSLGDAFGVPDVESHIDVWLGDARSIPVKEWVTFAKQESVIHAWLTDATFIWTLGDRENHAGKDTIGVMAKAMNLPVDFTSRFVDRVEALATQPVGESLIDAIRYLSKYGTAWRTVVDYRKLSFSGAFKRETAGLYSSKLLSDSLSIVGELSKLHRSLFNNMVIGGENFIQRAAINVNRRMVVSDFNALKEKVRTYGSAVTSGMASAEVTLRAFGVSLPKTPHLEYVSADDNVDLDNAKWQSNMEKAHSALDRYTSDLDNTRSKLSELLGDIERGQW